MMFCSSTFEPDGLPVVLVELSIICHQSYVANNYIYVDTLSYIYIESIIIINIVILYCNSIISI